MSIKVKISLPKNKAKRLRLSPEVRGRLGGQIRTQRRETIYKMTCNKNGGLCPCFVCGEHVAPEDATLEHKLERSKGGTDNMDNLAISHGPCNWSRSNH